MRTGSAEAYVTLVREHLRFTINSPFIISVYHIIHNSVFYTPLYLFYILYLAMTKYLEKSNN